MDERIMKVLEAAGARIADLEADLAEYKDANTYVCGQRDAAFDEIKVLKKHINDETARADTLSGKLSEMHGFKESERKEKLFWYEKYEETLSQLKALTADRANVEAVD